MQKQIIIYVLIAAAGFGLGFGLAYLDKKQAKDIAFETGFKAGQDALKQRLQDVGYLPMPIGEIFTLSGQVEKLENNKITLKIHPFDPFADPALDLRIVLKDNDTKIYRLKPKNPAEYEKEQAEFFKKMEEQAVSPELAELPAFPEPFIKIKAGLADIQPGQQITVTAEENIKEMKQFKAIEVVIQ